MFQANLICSFLYNFDEINANKSNVDDLIHAALLENEKYRGEIKIDEK